MSSKCDANQHIDNLQEAFSGDRVISSPREPAIKIALFMTRFDGRRDRYIKTYNEIDPSTGKLITWTEKTPLTETVVRDHLLGKYRIGVHPIVDGKAKFGAIDLDSNDLGHVDALSETFRVLEIPFKIAVSKSANGHFYSHSEEWLPAGLFQKTMQRIAETSGVPRSKGTKGTPGFRPGIDWPKIYPNEGAIFLPFFDLGNSIKKGRNVFVDPKSLQPFDLDGQWKELAHL